MSSYRRKYGDVSSLTDIGRELGISHARVRQLLISGLHKVKRACLRYGIDAEDIVGRPLSMLAQAEERE